MAHPIDTAVLPVAGLGTRLLPATKSVPKELMPVYDRPLIQFAIDEARSAGVRRLVFITHASKTAIEDYVRNDPDLNATLRDQGKPQMARQLERLVPSDPIEVVFVTQQEPRGLGHAVLCARDEVTPGPFAVILPDDLILHRISALEQMSQAYDPGQAGHMVAAMPVPADRTHKYGIFDSDLPSEGRAVRVSGFVEKPVPEDAPSRLAATGRYILDPVIFEALEETTPGTGGEIQLTDAIARGLDDPGVSAFHILGDRFDCGSHDGLLQAANAVGGDEDAARIAVTPAGAATSGIGGGASV